MPNMEMYSEMITMSLKDGRAGIAQQLRSTSGESAGISGVYEIICG